MNASQYYNFPLGAAANGKNPLGIMPFAIRRRTLDRLQLS